jgi:uncharacterized cupredoxin-like copper-binding protein
VQENLIKGVVPGDPDESRRTDAAARLVVGVRIGGGGVRNERGRPTNGRVGRRRGSAGYLAPAAEADRTIDVSMLDTMAYEPETISVDAGETITFQVTNEGTMVHEFMIGDEAMQQIHEDEMKQMGAKVHSHPNSVMLDAGADGEITWTFPDAATVLYGCHLPGHYAAGMVGTIEVR